MNVPRRLKGMEDVGPEAAQTMDWAAGTLCSFMARYGYKRVDTPLLEETELLLRKSGGELASKMYTFTDPGGHRVSLRPEFTSSIVRAYLQGMGQGGSIPMRWAYVGPVFRYEEDNAGSRQFIQVGAEIIGAAGPWADAEVMAIAAKGLSQLGVSGHRLVVGHLGVVNALLDDLGISDRGRLFLLNNVGALSRGAEGFREVKERAEGLGLLPGQNGMEKAATTITSEAALALLEQYSQRPPASSIGVRTPEEIRERFLRKQRFARDGGQFLGALESVSKLAQVQGKPSQALKAVRPMLRSSEAKGALKSAEETLAAFSSYDTGVPVSLDFGLARGIAYYTGLVFDIRHPAQGTVPLGGGGRYDGLVQALGGSESTAAMGFAWSLERVVDVLKSERGTINASAPRRNAFIVRPQSADATSAALLEAERLREQGETVYLETDAVPLAESVSRARRQGVSQVITVSADGSVRHRKVAD